MKESLSENGNRRKGTNSGKYNKNPADFDQKRALKLVKLLNAEQDITPFLLPVDPVEFNIPTYFEVIKQPMDL